VHAMQNHDELTYELVHWATEHHNDTYGFRGEEIPGSQLAETIRQDLLDKLTGESADYNLVFTTNGIACTTASVIAAAQGHKTLDAIEDKHVKDIRSAHLMLAMFNAWQPGVFALSAWDLLGALPLPAGQVGDLIEDGDTRWVERGAHDLIDGNPEAVTSSSGMPRGRSLYGSLPGQLKDRRSFASGLRRILAIREQYQIAVGSQVDVPDVAHPGMLVLVHRLDGGDSQAPAPIQITVLNFTGETIQGTVRSDKLVARRGVRDVIAKTELAMVDDLLSFPVTLEPYAGLFLVVDEEEPVVEEAAAEMAATAKAGTAKA
jgi:trehalose synthase